MPSIHKAKVDFGDPSDDRLLPSLSVEGLSPGVAVILHDNEGNVCGGTVSRVDESLAWILPDWSTWVPAVFQPVGGNYGPVPKAATTQTPALTGSSSLRMRVDPVRVLVS